MNTILWLEDEIDSFEAFSFLLKDKYSITRAVDFKDAEIKYDSQKYDALVVDIIIPSGKKEITIEELLKNSHRYFGLDFIMNLRKSGDKTPIIVLSVVSDRATLESIKKIDNNIEILWKYDSDAITVKETLEGVANLCMI